MRLSDSGRCLGTLRYLINFEDIIVVADFLPYLKKKIPGDNIVNFRKSCHKYKKKHSKTSCFINMDNNLF